MAYHAFASYYDELTFNIDYRTVADFYTELFERYHRRPELLLDAACGTGSLSVELARRGYNVIGCDASEAMLSVAFDKARQAEADLLFLHQPIEKLDLYGTVQAVVCNLDSINHIAPQRIDTAFQKLSLFLEPGGLLIFDVNSRYKFETVLADHIFLYDMPSVYCIWQNRYEAEKLHIHLDLFCREGKAYTRREESFKEYYYSHEALQRLIESHDMDLLECVADYTDNAVVPDTQRIHYICQKRG